MKTKEEEVVEVQVLTPEQIKALPKEAVESVTYLTKTVGGKDLAILNPLVTELLDLREQGAKLKLKPVDEDGNYDKANIREFMDCQGSIKNYRSRIKEAAKGLKAPYQQINKGYITIEKAFIAEATVVLDNNEELFKPYREAEAIKKQAKIDAKNKALNDAVEKANKTAREATLQMEKTNTYNYIKYERINARIVEKASDAVINSNQRSLQELRKDITELDYETILHGRDDSVLSQEVRAELKEHFVNSRTKALTLISDRLTAIQIELDNIALESAKTPQNTVEALVESEKTVDASSPPLIPPPPMKIPDVEPYKEPDFSSLTDAEFINYINKEGRKLLILTQNRLAKVPTSSPEIYDLRNSLSTFN